MSSTTLNNLITAESELSSTFRAIISKIKDQLFDLEVNLQYESQQMANMLQVFYFTRQFLGTMCNDAIRAATTGQILVKPPHPGRLSSIPDKEMTEAWENAKDHGAYIHELKVLQEKREDRIKKKNMVIEQLRKDVLTAEDKWELYTTREKFDRMG